MGAQAKERAARREERALQAAADAPATRPVYVEHANALDAPVQPSQVIHRKRVFDGRPGAAEEMHRRLAWGGNRCTGCKVGVPVIRIIRLARVVDAIKHVPQLVALIRLQHDGGMPVVRSKYGNLVQLSEAFACMHCRVEAERAAARAPSWNIIDIDRGPGADRPVVQVAG